MATRQERTVQEDWSAGSVKSVAGHLIPPNGAAGIRNGLLLDDGAIFRRGGSEGISDPLAGAVLRENLAQNPSGEVAKKFTDITGTSARELATGAPEPVAGDYIDRHELAGGSYEGTIAFVAPSAGRYVASCNVWLPSGQSLSAGCDLENYAGSTLIEDLGATQTDQWKRVHEVRDVVSGDLSGSMALQVDSAAAGSEGSRSGGTFADDASVGTVAWSNLGNVGASDNVRAGAALLGTSGISHYLKATNFGFAIPAGATIAGIKVEIERSTAGSGVVADESVKIVKGGAITGLDQGAFVTAWPASDAYATYGGVAHLWGESWTVADINAADFGVAIAAKHSVASVTALIDHIRITVYYTEAGHFFTDAVQLEKIVSPEQSPTTYFDGDTSGAVWSGTAHASTSQELGDAEPLTLLWRGDLTPGHRTLIANEDEFAVLDDNGAPLVLGAGGMEWPKPIALIKDMLFIGGGTIYAGSRLTSNYSTGTISTTLNSRTITGSGTTWSTNVDVGMLIQVGNERVYVVEQVGSNTSITLTEPYEGTTGSGKSYTARPIYTITTADPYPDSDVYAVVQNRLTWAAGNHLLFSTILKPHLGDLTENDHEFPADLRGIAEVGTAAVVFTDTGTWTITGMAFDIVDSNGNAQHTVRRLSDHILAEGAGYTHWDQTLVAPCLSGIFLIDGISAPRELSDNIDPLYYFYVRSGYRMGQAAVFRDHYLLPIISSSVEPKTLLVARLDRALFDRRKRATFPWVWFDQCGGELSCLVRDDQQALPKLYGAEARSSARVTDCTHFFLPDEGHRVDPDGMAHTLDIVTRDYATGGLTKNMVRSLETGYELSGESGVRLSFAWSDGELAAGVPLWGQVNWGQFNWAGPVGAIFNELNDDAPPERGPRRHKVRVNKSAEHIRFRIRSIGAADVCVLRGLEMAVRPSGAVRR